MEECKARLKFSDCRLLLTDDTMPALVDFMAGFEALLIRNRETLSPPLASLADVFVEMTEWDSNYARETIPDVFSWARDESNWAYVERFLMENDHIERVALVVGGFHVSNLTDIIARRNATGIALRFVNVVEISYALMFQNELKQVEDVPATSVLNAREARVLVAHTLKKLRLWRELTQ
jgi:hypothetical protein